MHGVVPGEAWEVLADWAGQLGSGEQASPSLIATAFYGRLWEQQVSAEKAMTQD